MDDYCTNITVSTASTVNIEFILELEVEDFMFHPKKYCLKMVELVRHGRLFF